MFSSGDLPIDSSNRANIIKFMMLSNKALTSFKKIYEKKLSEKLSDEEANEKALDLLCFMKVIYRPVPLTDKQLLESYRYGI